ncbi:MAG: VacJ family lipoprotein [Epsilonproteobacteria bacterium]|nr:MAG: VacJ family lipoprotein [Campylobacterota bacterium]
MKFIYVFLTMTFFTFQGCTTKQAAAEINPQEVETEISSSDTPQTSTPVEEKNENDIDEFEEEFSEEETNEIIDPLSGYNRAMTSFNDTLMTYVLIPVSEAYAYIMPQPIRLGLSNAVDNIHFPIRFANNLLQGKFQNSSDEFERFIINSTVGVAGLIDVASDHMTTPIPAHEEDFGQTLGHYGVGSGFHIVLPFFGPSNVRDTVGFVADAYISPLVYTKDLENYKIPKNKDHSMAILLGAYINKTSLNLGKYEDLKEDAVDLYPFFRDIYEQKRDAEIAE